MGVHMELMKKRVASAMFVDRHARVVTLTVATAVVLSLAACGNEPGEVAQGSDADETVIATHNSGADTPKTSTSTTSDDLEDYLYDEDKELFVETGLGAGVPAFEGYKVSIKEVSPDGYFTSTEWTDPDDVARRSLAVIVQEDAPASGYRLSAPSMEGKSVAEALNTSPVKYWINCTESIEPAEISYGEDGASLTFSESDTKKVDDASRAGWLGGRLVLSDIESPCEKAKEILDEIGDRAPDNDQVIGLRVSANGSATGKVWLSKFRTPQS